MVKYSPFLRLMLTIELPIGRYLVIADCIIDKLLLDYVDKKPYF